MIELNLRKKRWLINCSYNPNNGNIESHLDSVFKSLDIDLNRYENVILLGDYNAGIDDSFMKMFYENYDLKSLVKEPTCFKNLENPCSVESCVNKTIIWLYVCVSESLFNVSIVSRLIYTNCVIESICTPFALFLHRFNQDFRESIHVEVVRVLCAIFKIQWF